MTPAFVTASPHKARIVESVIGFPIDTIDFSLPEIQSLEIETVCRQKALKAYEEFRRPIIVEDTGLYIGALGGLPGPFVRWFLESIGCDGVCRLVRGEPNREATVKSAFGFHDGVELRVFTGELLGSIPQAPLGQNGFGWDSIFLPIGSEKTFAQMENEEKTRYSLRRRILVDMRNFLVALNSR